MCGRYTLKTHTRDLARLFRGRPMDDAAGFFERYNIAPMQWLPIVRQDDDGRTIALARWGLIPEWADDPDKRQAPPINARADRLSQSPMFRQPFSRRRCLVPATGFYEWQARSQGKGKQPHLIQLRDGRVFAFAGLWERWSDSNGHDIDSFTIVTTASNELVKFVHNRMPVVLPRDAWDTWLDPQTRDNDQLMRLLGPPEAKGWETMPVSRRVNSPTNDDPDVIEVVGDG